MKFMPFLVFGVGVNGCVVALFASPANHDPFGGMCVVTIIGFIASAIYAASTA